MTTKMAIGAEERLRLWSLFQACDLDHDGLIDVNDIRLLCRRTKLTHYTPDVIMNLFDITDDTKITFDDFVNKKAAHDELQFMSPSSSVSEFSLQPDEVSSPEQYVSEYLSSNLCSDSSDTDSDLELYSSKEASNDTKSYRFLIPSSRIKNGNHFRATHNLYKRFNDNFIEQMENIELNEESKRKVEQMHLEYVTCLNELSRENAIICSQLERSIKEGNYIRSKMQSIQLDQYEIRERFNDEKATWNREKEQLQEKISHLELIAHKHSLHETWPKDEWCLDNHETDLATNQSRMSSGLEGYSLKDTFETPTISRSYLFRLSSQLADKCLALSEIISNLRLTELQMTLAGCNVANLSEIDDYELDNKNKKSNLIIMMLLDQSDENRANAEHDAIEFLQTLDKDFLLQYMPLDDYKNLFESGYPLEFDCSIQETLVELLRKFKQHFESINYSLNHFDLIECNTFLDSKSHAVKIQSNYLDNQNIDSIKFNSL